MFTGLVERVGELRSRTLHGASARLGFAADFSAFELGESISCDGVCLTVVEFDARGFEVDASPETLERTTLGSLALGAPVNFERALLASGRFGGHIVTGHVDSVVSLRARTSADDSLVLVFSLPPSLAGFVAAKGSVAVNGVSLTVNHVTDASFDITLIPHSQAKTNLGGLRVGDSVNLEVDLLARYAARLLATAAVAPTGAEKDQRFMDRLREAGYV